MPRGDRTGPLGYGPMTGRGAGYCTGNGAPGYMNMTQCQRRGFGGGGRGWRNMFYATGLPFWARGNAAASVHGASFNSATSEESSLSEC